MGHPTCITTVIGCSMESPITHVQFHWENSIICFLLFYDCNSGASTCITTVIGCSTERMLTVT